MTHASPLVPRGLPLALLALVLLPGPAAAIDRVVSGEYHSTDFLAAGDPVGRYNGYQMNLANEEVSYTVVALSGSCVQAFLIIGVVVNDNSFVIEDASTDVCRSRFSAKYVAEGTYTLAISSTDSSQVTYSLDLSIQEASTGSPLAFGLCILIGVVLFMVVVVLIALRMRRRIAPPPPPAPMYGAPPPYAPPPQPGANGMPPPAPAYRQPQQLAADPSPGVTRHTCPVCRNTFAVPGQSSLAALRCPHCGAQVQVGTPAPAPLAAPRSSPPPPVGYGSDPETIPEPPPPVGYDSPPPPPSAGGYQAPAYQSPGYQAPAYKPPP